MTTNPMHATRTIADHYAFELSQLADALEARDWDRVAQTCPKLKGTERLMERMGAEADYDMALIGRLVWR